MEITDLMNRSISIVLAKSWEYRYLGYHSTDEVKYSLQVRMYGQVPWLPIGQR